MMGVVDLQHEIGNGELELVHPQFSGLRLRRQPVTGAEVEQDVGGLPDHQRTRFQKRRREWRRTLAPLHHFHHRAHAIAAARDVAVGGTGVLEREADIFAAALDEGPVIELVAHWRSLMRGGITSSADGMTWSVRRKTIEQPVAAGALEIGRAAVAAAVTLRSRMR